MRLACVSMFIASVGLGCAPSSPEVATPVAPAATSSAAPASGDDGTAPASTAPAAESAPAELVWLDDEAAARAASEASGKPLLVDFAAEWCAPCTQLETITFADPAVRARLADFVLLRIDVTEQSDADLAIQKRYGAASLPAIRVRAPDGTELVRISEFVEPEALLEALAAVE